MVMAHGFALNILRCLFVRMFGTQLPPVQTMQRLTTLTTYHLTDRYLMRTSFWKVSANHDRAHELDHNMPNMSFIDLFPPF